jgi:hypothetical protein
MPLVTSRTSLSQGGKSSESVAFTASAGANTTLTGTGLPVVGAGDFFEIRNSPITGNNGLYIATGTPTTSSVSCTKVFGADPTDDTSETVDWLGNTTTQKSVFFDTTTNGSTAIMEKGNVDAAGVIGQAIYSFAMQEWKDDDFLIANSPFPMLTIDADAGKFIIGQDISGNNNGATWLDSATHSIRTRKLLRNAGWNEVSSAGVTLARYVGVVTLGTFEDENNDTAYYQFGDDTTVDDTVDFDFAGPVNEAVKFYDLIGDLSGDTPAFGTTSTITRATGSFITDGFKVGGQVTVTGSTSNDGTYVLTAVAATTLTVAATPLTVEAWGTSEIAVNNDNKMTLRLRVRDADPKGKTFAQANLASAGKDALGNFVYAFPLANGSDQKIDVTDIGIDSDSNGTPDVSPYSGMSITYYASPQARSDLVGGTYNFGIIVDGNNGTAQQVFEFIQWSLRSTGGNGTGDIDNDADVAIGRTMDGLAYFVGDTAHFGTADGLSVPRNPDGGGSGVYVDNLNATSKNDVVLYDNAGGVANPRTFPETIAVTLDFNDIAIDDTTCEYDLFYDRTIRTPSTTLTDLVIGTAGGGQFTSAGSNLPSNSEIVVGAYVRISGLTGGDAPMNGVYQIVAINTANDDWTVTRYDGQTIVAVTATAAELDQNCVDTPDAILVHENVSITATTISFTATDTISDSGSGFGIFAVGDIIEVEGTVSNDGVYKVATAAAGTLTIDTTDGDAIATEGAGSSFTITKCVSGLADADYVFSYDFDGNTQGGRTVSTDTFVKAKAVGSSKAQYVQSTVQTIESGVPLTIPVAPATERNYA